MPSSGVKLPTVDLGQGPPVVILQGFGTRPETYLPPARLLAETCRVVIPNLFSGRGRWTAQGTLDSVCLTLDLLGIERATFIGHSFGGTIELEMAALDPSRVTELIFADTLAMSREWTLAREAFTHPFRLLWMATPSAARDFFAVSLSHPRQLTDAAWWGFISDRRQQIAIVARTSIPVHVLWAERDSLLSRSDGLDFAKDLGATFTVVHGTGRGPVDHDWIYRHPKLLIPQLQALGVAALAPAVPPSPAATPSPSPEVTPPPGVTLQPGV
jgi:pimeloyl-ACP methyl ester carboxylesterase